MSLVCVPCAAAKGIALFSFLGEGGGGAESLTFLPDLSFPTDEKIKLFLVVVSLKPRKAISAGFCAELLGGLLCLET